MPRFNTIAELHHILYDINCNCVFITENWLTAYISHGLLDPKTNFNIVHKDRINDRGSGVCALIKNTYSVALLKTKFQLCPARESAREQVCNLLASC